MSSSFNSKITGRLCPRRTRPIGYIHERFKVLTGEIISIYHPGGAQHELTTGGSGMTVSLNIDIPMDIAARQMSITTFGPSPASGIEVLGIATATCLLAFFLCLLFCAGLRIFSYSWFASSPELHRGDTPRIIRTSAEQDGSEQSICKRIVTPLSRSPIFHDEQPDDSQPPCSARPGCVTRMKIARRNNIIPERYYYTQIPPKCKPLSRKRLLMSKPVISSVRRENTTLDMEEGLGLSYDAAAAAVPHGLGDLPRPYETATCRESKTKDGEHPGRSFLHCRGTSL
ncbi:hypothetical protein FHL15_004586 [Xylaria flabelliformis]|uniref:Uncharacterized protein n=1 Tax=Xylaria flabelliformis TaxID=2512241 RepID=A0A553I2L0_9PEZI|nr:hypothetical protein FHL15_004586 [Xylaria flabelliformis]